MNIVRIKTDASSKPEIGFTLAYECKIEYENTVIDKFDDSMFSEKQVKSTEAEMLGIAYALTQTYKRFDNDPSEFQIAIQSDCEHAVRSFNEHDVSNDKLRKTTYPILNKFDCWRINWIPRILNKRTNNLARERLRRAEDGL